MLEVTRAAVIQGWDELVTDLGADPAIVMEQTSWNLSELVDPDATLPTKTVSNVLARAAEATSCPHFGLLLAKRRDFNTYLGLLGQIIQASETIGDALREGFKVFSLHMQGAHWELESHGNISNVSRHIDGFLERGSVQSTQLAVGLTWRFFRMISNGSWHPTMVSFTFVRPENTLVYKRFFSVPVLFGADKNSVVFHTEDLGIPLPRHDEYLLGVLKNYAETLQTSRRRDLADEVKDLVRKNLQDGKTNIEEIAKFFPFEQRTLQRKLNQLGTNYRKILLEVRISIAQDRLMNSGTSIARIADSLDYRDQGSFTKAFKGQTGLTPRSWRVQARQ